MNAGLYYDIPESVYHGDPCDKPSLSRGLAGTLITKSPLHAKLEHPRLSKVEPIDPTAAMDFGSLGHKLLLGKGADVQVGEWADWKTNAAKDFRSAARAAGAIPVLQHVYERALALEEGARAEFVRLGIAESFAVGKSEVVALWQEEDFWLRAMYDRLVMSPDSAIIYDLKITESAHPDACKRQIVNMGYDLQEAHYPRGLTKLLPALAGRTKFVFLFVENSAPFSVTPVELNGEWKKLAQMKWERAFALWKKCLTANQWPPYASQIVRVEPPAWMMAQELQREYAVQ